MQERLRASSWSLFVTGKTPKADGRSEPMRKIMHLNFRSWYIIYQFIMESKFIRMRKGGICLPDVCIFYSRSFTADRNCVVISTAFSGMKTAYSLWTTLHWNISWRTNKTLMAVSESFLMISYLFHQAPGRKSWEKTNDQKRLLPFAGEIKILRKWINFLIRWKRAADVGQTIQIYRGK